VPSAEPTTPTGQPTSGPTTIFNGLVSFNASQVLRGDRLNVTELVTSGTLQYETFVATVSAVSSVPSEDIIITSAEFVGESRPLHLLLRRRLQISEVRLEYDISTTTVNMDAASTEEMYDAIVNRLETATNSATAGPPSLFESALATQAVLVAAELGLPDVAWQVFQDVTSDAVSVAPTFDSIVLRTAPPTGQPTSMPSCGTGAFNEDGSSSGCQPCPPGEYRPLSHVHHGLACVKCGLDQYSSGYGNEACETCPAPAATLNVGSTSCDAFSLRGDVTVAATAFTVLVAGFFYSVFFAGCDRTNFGALALLPALDFISDVVYVTQVRFYSMWVFYLALMCLLLPNAMFIHHLVQVRARPRLLVTFPCRVLCLGHLGWSPLWNGYSVDPFLDHDESYKLLSWAVLWPIVVGAQVVLAVLYTAFVAVHMLCVWLPVLVVGFLLFALKGMCVKRVYNQWLSLWCGHRYVTEKLLLKEDHEQYPVDTGMMNESILSEFVLESIPELLLQGLNNSAAGQWLAADALFSFVFSVAVIVNSLYRFGYYSLWKNPPVAIADVPNKLEIPNPRKPLGPSLKFELKVNKTLAESEGNLFRIADDTHLHRLVEKAYGEVITEASARVQNKDYAAAAHLLQVLFMHDVTSPSDLASSPAAIASLHGNMDQARHLRYLAKCPDLDTWLAKFSRTYVYECDEDEDEDKDKDKNGQHDPKATVATGVTYTTSVTDALEGAEGVEMEVRRVRREKEEEEGEDGEVDAVVRPADTVADESI